MAGRDKLYSYSVLRSSSLRQLSIIIIELIIISIRTSQLLGIPLSVCIDNIRLRFLYEVNSINTHPIPLPYLTSASITYAELSQFQIYCLTTKALIL